MRKCASVQCRVPLICSPRHGYFREFSIDLSLRIIPVANTIGDCSIKIFYFLFLNNCLVIRDPDMHMYAQYIESDSRGDESPKRAIAYNFANKTVERDKRERGAEGVDERNESSFWRVGGGEKRSAMREQPRDDVNTNRREREGALRFSPSPSPPPPP